ncbi:MAG TPA: polysaccharide deacetylase family protein [Pyrinomonadaceae bacterium]|nr:polysaccharide deacetylase family protein [Pyrinomonadaceae bacterium]
MRAIAIMYHDVVAREEHERSGFAGADAALYKLDPAQFAAHLEAMGEAVGGAKPARVFELAGDAGKAGSDADGGAKGEGNTNGRRVAATPFLITFDDGGASAATRIAGMLEARGWRGHFLVTTNYIGARSFVTREQVRELHAGGHVVGSHSCSHPLRMASCSRAQLLDEWQRSVAALSEIVGERVRVASVPGGHYSRAVAETAAESGIEFLFTSEPTARVREVEGCTVVGRYSVQRWTTPEAAAAFATGKFAPRARQALLWNAKKLTKRLGGEYYLKMRRTLIGHGS